MRRWIIAALMLLAGCVQVDTTPITPRATAEPTAAPPPTGTPEPTAMATPAPTETMAPSPSPEPASIYGPVEYPAGINPLTGLPVSDADRLERRPLLVKVSNESPDIRPLSGLSAADHLWLHQAEGWGQTRFTAIYLGESPEYVGSVRSVRPIDSDVLIPMYDGILAYSGSSQGMTYRLQFETPYWERVFRELPDRDHLVRLEDVPRPGTDFYHRLFARPEAVWESAELRGNALRDFDLRGLAFSAEVPPGGEAVAEATILYQERLGPQVRLAYEGEQWLMFYTDRNAGSEEQPEIDRLNGQQLAFENVIILFAVHSLTNFAEDTASGARGVQVDFDGTGEGYLLRNGQVFAITWEHDLSAEGMLITLLDQNGEVIPLKPGKTFFATSVAPNQGEFEEYAAVVTFE